MACGCVRARACKSWDDAGLRRSTAALRPSARARFARGGCSLTGERAAPRRRCAFEVRAEADAGGEQGERMRRFVEWFKREAAEENLGGLAAVGMAEVPGMGLGFVAARPVAKGEILVTVPDGLMVTERCVEDDRDIGPAVRRAQAAAQGERGERGNVKGLEGHALMALFALHAARTGATRWDPYWRIVPETIDSTALWDEEELALLRGTEAHRMALDRRRDVDDEWADLRRLLFRESPDLFPHGRDSDPFSLAAFRRRYAVISSRCWKPRAAGSVTLVPFADSFNHHRIRGGEVAFVGGREAGPLQAVVIAERDAEPGEQLYISYGRHTNAELALDYGFALDPNPDDRTALLVPLPEQREGPLREAAAAVLGARGLPRSASSVKVTLAAAGLGSRGLCIPAPALAHLRIVAAESEEELAGHRAAARRPLGPASERRALQAVREAVRERLEAMHGEEAFEQAAGEVAGRGGASGWRVQVARAVVEGERRLLEAAAAEVARLEREAAEGAAAGSGLDGAAPA